MACSTAWRLSSETEAVPFRMRDTVLGDTPAAWATWSSVTGPAEPRLVSLERVGREAVAMGSAVEQVASVSTRDPPA